MNPEMRESLANVLLCLADDELILGHRDSEWCGHAPILEEDIAFANIALDELGHASLWYQEVAQLRDQAPMASTDAAYPDELVFFREPAEFRCLPLVELPRGDWAFSIMRQYLYDAAELIRMEAISNSAYPPTAEIARKIYKEEIYHHRHTRAWVERLGLGTSESQRRLQNALDALWPYANQIFEPLPDEEALVQAKVLPESTSLHVLWLQEVVDFLSACELKIPESSTLSENRMNHSAHLAVLLREMQSVARMDRQATW